MQQDGLPLAAWLVPPFYAECDGEITAIVVHAYSLFRHRTLRAGWSRCRHRSIAQEFL